MNVLRKQDLKECTACACFAVRRAARVITQHYDRALRPSGLRATQFTLLTMLGVGGPLPLSRVADRLGMERTTLTRNLKALIDAGLIGVEHGDDRRVRTILSRRREIVRRLPRCQTGEERNAMWPANSLPAFLIP